MQARVTVVLVARTGAAHLQRTLDGIGRQTRRPDAVIAVDLGSTDGSAALLAAAGPTQLVTVSGKLNFGSAVSRALHVTPPAETDHEWLWLLAEDNAPAPTALAQLLAAIEVAPSVAIAGPKLMRAAQPDVIAEFGETLTRLGASIALVEGELDQAQHDIQDDVLGVAASGMLVRRSLWVRLGGFDPALPSIDAALDFSLRARLAGFRVITVPGAKVLSSGGPEHFGRKAVTERRRARIARAAQLHRRLVYAPAAGLPLHWLSLVPLAIARAIIHLVAKRPGLVLGEISTAFRAAFGGGVLRARRNLRRTRTLGWASISALRMPRHEVAERRGQAREESLNAFTPAPRRARNASFVAHGGLWMVVLSALIGVVAYARLLAAPALIGGQLLPLSATVGELWSHVGYGWRDLGVGFVGAADPFAAVLAVLGSITFWSPSFSLVLLYFVALPVSALGAWFAARTITSRAWLPSFAALLWALAPPLLGALDTGHPGATISHMLLPWLFFAALSAPRSWAASAAAALLFATVAASTPSLAPALLVLWLALLAAHPRRIVRLIGIPLPALALFLPLVVQQLARGNPLGLVADPGVVAGGSETSAVHLALLSPGPGLSGWVSVLAGFGLAHLTIVIVVAALLVPVGALALLALFVPGSRRAVPALIVALLGFVTAVASAHLGVSTIDGSAVTVWPGAGQSLFWLGLIASSLCALDGIRRAAAPLAAFAGLAIVVLALPLLAGLYLRTSPVMASTRLLPAVVSASGAERPELGTLILKPAAGETLSATLERGAGTTLDDQSTLAATSTTVDASTRQLATLAGNLASRSSYNAGPDLDRFTIGFVLLRPAGGNDAVHKRTAEALDGNAGFSAVGSTAQGELWRNNTQPAKQTQALVSTATTSIGRAVIVGQGIVFAFTLLLGIPTVRRRRRGEISGSVLREPANTFNEEELD